MATSLSSAALSAASRRHPAVSQRSEKIADRKVACDHSRVRSVQRRGEEKLSACKEIFFAGFPCAWQHRRSPPSAKHLSTTLGRPLAYSEAVVRGFFEKYGTVDFFLYDEARGMGSVMFAKGADAEQCYLAVHLSFIPAPGENSEGNREWEKDAVLEALVENEPHMPLSLLCLEFAHCCPFVNPFLLTRDACLRGDVGEWEVPGGELSRALLLHEYPALLLSPCSQSSATVPVEPVAPRVVVCWKSETLGTPASRVEVVEDGSHDVAAQLSPASLSQRVKRIGPTFPGRGLQPAALEEKLWQCLQPDHIPVQDGASVTVMDLWWEFYSRYVFRKTQPSADRIADGAFRYAEQPSLAQEVLQLQRQSFECTYGDEEAAKKALHRLAHDHVYHSTFCYLHVKQKLMYDPTWASLMRDVYTPKAMLLVQAWKAIHEKAATASSLTPPPTASSTARRRSAVKAAFEALCHSPSTEKEDTQRQHVTDQLWRTMPRMEAAANLIENVRLLEKVRRGMVDRSGHDMVSTQSAGPSNSGNVGSADNEVDSAYPSMSGAQRDEQLYSAVMQNMDGYVATGTAEEMVSLCEDPIPFRYVKGHIGYEEAHRRSSSWRVYMGALWVSLIALCAFGFGVYSTASWLGIDKVQETHIAGRKRREYHNQLRNLLHQQRALLNQTRTNNTQLEAVRKKYEEAVRHTSEAAAQAGGMFRVQVKYDM